MKIENWLTESNREKGNVRKCTLSVTSQIFHVLDSFTNGKKKPGFFAKLPQALAKGVSVYLCYWD